MQCSKLNMLTKFLQKITGNSSPTAFPALLGFLCSSRSSLPLPGMAAQQLQAGSGKSHSSQPLAQWRVCLLSSVQPHATACEASGFLGCTDTLDAISCVAGLAGGGAPFSMCVAATSPNFSSGTGQLGSAILTLPLPVLNQKRKSWIHTWPYSFRYIIITGFCLGAS